MILTQPPKIKRQSPIRREYFDIGGGVNIGGRGLLYSVSSRAPMFQNVPRYWLLSWFRISANFFGGFRWGLHRHRQA